MTEEKRDIYVKKIKVRFLINCTNWATIYFKIFEKYLINLVLLESHWQVEQFSKERSIKMENILEKRKSKIEKVKDKTFQLVIWND